MKSTAIRYLASGMILACSMALPVRAEILPMLNYESKPDDQLKELKLDAGGERVEGIAIMDVDPDSANFGKILMNIPLPGDLISHHIFYDRAMTKAYITALGQPQLHVLDMTANPYRLSRIDIPECLVGEDVMFSDDNSTWYLTCMGSNVVVVGSVATDHVTDIIETAEPYPHGIAVNESIDRMLVSSTVNAADLGSPGDSLTVIRLSDHAVLDSVKVSDAPSPSGEAPVEVLFVPGSNPPVAYVTNMFGASLSSLVWNADSETFEGGVVFDFGPMEMGVPLEIYFNGAADRMYVTTAVPGHMHIFDISQDPAKPVLLKTLASAGGAHHVAFTRDGRYAFVQTTLLNLPGMSDGSITVVDMQTEEVIGTIDTFKETGFNPNSIVLLPEYNDLAGH